MPHNHNMEKHSTASKEGDEDIVALATHPDPRAEHTAMAWSSRKLTMAITGWWITGCWLSQGRVSTGPNSSQSHWEVILPSSDTRSRTTMPAALGAALNWCNRNSSVVTNSPGPGHQLESWTEWITDCVNTLSSVHKELKWQVLQAVLNTSQYHLLGNSKCSPKKS